MVVHDESPEYLVDTFWTGVLDHIEKKGEKKRAYFKMLTPPRKAYFVVQRPVWEQTVGKRYGRLGFRPDWVQECYVSNPVKR